MHGAVRQTVSGFFEGNVAPPPYSAVLDDTESHLHTLVSLYKVSRVNNDLWKIILFCFSGYMNFTCRVPMYATIRVLPSLDYNGLDG